MPLARALLALLQPRLEILAVRLGDAAVGVAESRSVPIDPFTDAARLQMDRRRAARLDRTVTERADQRLRVGPGLRVQRQVFRLKRARELRERMHRVAIRLKSDDVDRLKRMLDKLYKIAEAMT